MPLILIDANQYLALYESVCLRDILPVLLAVRKHVVVTRQIVNEVQRQKLRVIKKRLGEEFTKKFAKSLPITPPILNAEGRQAFQTAFVAAQTSFENAQQIANDLSNKLLADVAISTDEVSTSLVDIFAGAVEPTPDQLDRARARREIGNPPGKGTALGDQVTWEQFLERARGETQIWIFTADGDYAASWGRQHYLNPLLRSELLAVLGPEPQIEVHGAIGNLTGVADFLKLLPANAPSDAQVEAMVKEQESLPPREQYSYPVLDDERFRELQKAVQDRRADVANAEAELGPDLEERLQQMTDELLKLTGRPSLDNARQMEALSTRRAALEFKILTRDTLRHTLLNLEKWVAQEIERRN